MDGDLIWTFWMHLFHLPLRLIHNFLFVASRIRLVISGLHLLQFSFSLSRIRYEVLLGIIEHHILSPSGPSYTANLTQAPIDWSSKVWFGVTHRL